MWPSHPSDRDSDTFFGHGPEPERTPGIWVRVFAPSDPAPTFHIEWASVFDVIARFGDGWQILIDEGSHDVRVDILRMPSPEVLHGAARLVREGRA